jgi:hypothetical protein
MSLFSKRGETASGAPVPPPAVTYASRQQLIEQRNALEGQVRALTSKRHQHAFAWASGDQKAWVLIEAIDKERQQLSAQVEALSQAITVQQAQERERKQQDDLDRRRAEFDKTKARIAPAKLAKLVRARYESLARHLQVLRNQQCDHEVKMHWIGTSPPYNDPHAPVGVANIPKAVALELVESLCRFRRATPAPHDASITQYVDVVDQKLADEFVDALLAEAQLPECPDTIEEFIAMWGERSKASNIPVISDRKS